MKKEEMNGQRIIRTPELLGMLGVSAVTVWRLEKAGKFPRRINLGANSVGWISGEIDQWIAEKVAERKG